MKKLLVYICALVICFNVVGVDVSAAPATPTPTEPKDITITDFDTDEDDICEGTKFDLEINLDIPTTAKPIYLNMTASSFRIVGKSLPLNIDTINTSGNTYKIPLKCTGSDSNITLTFSYSDSGKTYTSTNTISIDLEDSTSSSSSSSTSSSPDKYNTELVIEDQEIPTITAGNDVDLSFELKNAGFYTAKNIKVEFLPPEGIDFESNSILNLVNNIPHLKKNETADLEYSFHLNSSTPAKTYKCELKCSYYPLNSKQPVTTTQEIYIKVRKGIPDVDLRISDIAYAPSMIKPEDEVKLSFSINNNYGSSTVKSVDVSIKDDENNYFTLLNGINSYQITNIRPDEKGKEVNLNIFASSDLKKGSYPITIVLKYNDSSNIEQTLEKKIYLMSEGPEKEEEKGNTEITVKNIVSPTQQINYDQSFDISFDIINTGEEKAENFYVSVYGDEEIVPISQNKNTINELAVGDTKSFTCKFRPIEEASTKNHLLRIEIKGKNEEDLPTMTQYVGIYVKAKEKEEDEDKKNTSKPIIIINDFSLDPSICNAGENFNLGISFKNTHKTKTVKNVKISLAAEQNTDSDEEKTGSVFTPVDSSSTFFISEIKPQQAIGKELSMFTIPYAASKVHNLDLSIYYEYSNGDDTLTETITDKIPITVVQPSSFITNEYKMPEQAFVGEPFSISLEISNTGKTTLDNFTVEIEGFEATNNRAYLGNLERGNTTYYDTDLYSNEEGEITGNIVFSYTGPDGKTQITKQEIKTTVIAMDMGMDDTEAGNFDELMPPEETKKSNKTLIIIIASVAVVAIITIVVVRKKIKKKKEMNFDE